MLTAARTVLVRPVDWRRPRRRRSGVRRAPALLIGLLVLLGGGMGLTGCSASDSVVSSADVADTPNGAKLDPQAFADAAAEASTVLIDVRTAEEFASGHLPGARNLDIAGADFAGQLDELDESADYAVYCRTDNRSGAAVAQMLDAGFTSVVDLRGGIVAWQQAGGKVVTGD